jgi:hypothetical protein
VEVGQTSLSEEWAMPAKKPISRQLVREFGEPFLVTATVTVRPNGQGSVNLEALKNPSGGPMLIEEIHWSLYPGTNNVTGLAATIGCKLSLGNIPLTADFVPLSLFGKEENIAAADTSILPGIYQQDFVWRLQNPLYVKAGEVLSPLFLHRGFTTYSVDCQVSYLCRTVPPDAEALIKKDIVPWVANYLPAPVVQAGTELTIQSGELDLVNPFDTPMHVQRFSGHLYSLGAIQVLESVATRPQETQTKVQMWDSLGHQVVREVGTRFRAVFESNYKTWEVPHDLAPHAYYIIQIATGSVDLSVIQTGVLFQIGMVGDREVTR